MKTEEQVRQDQECGIVDFLESLKWSDCPVKVYDKGMSGDPILRESSTVIEAGAVCVLENGVKFFLEDIELIRFNKQYTTITVRS